MLLLYLFLHPTIADEYKKAGQLFELDPTTCNEGKKIGAGAERHFTSWKAMMRTSQKATTTLLESDSFRIGRRTMWNSYLTFGLANPRSYVVTG